jgi:hypothetical protein
MELAIVVDRLVDVEASTLHDLLLSLELGNRSSNGLSVLLGLQKRHEVDSGPQLFSLELSSLLNTSEGSVKTVTADTAESSKVDKGSESSCREVSLS